MCPELQLDSSSLFNTFHRQDPREIVARGELVKYFIQDTDAPILEIGAGFGEVAALLQDTCEKIYALETDHTLFSVMNTQLLSRTKSSTVALPAKLSDLNFYNEMQVIFSFNHFSFLPEYVKNHEIQSAFKALRVDGYLVITHSQFVADPSHEWTQPEVIFSDNDLLVEKKSEIVTVTNELEYEVKFSFELLFKNQVLASAVRNSKLYLQEPSKTLEMCLKSGFSDAWIYSDVFLNPYKQGSSGYVLVARK